MKVYAGYAAKAPWGELMLWSVAWRRHLALKEIVTNYRQEWKSLYREGWRIVRVYVSESAP